jgi:hypothetical protein
MLKRHHKINFETLISAIEAGDVCLVAGRRTADGASVALICAVGQDEDGDVTLTPFAELVDSDPFDAYVPAWTAQGPDPNAN